MYPDVSLYHISVLSTATLPLSTMGKILFFPWKVEYGHEKRLQTFLYLCFSILRQGKRKQTDILKLCIIFIFSGHTLFHIAVMINYHSTTMYHTRR